MGSRIACLTPARRLIVFLLLILCAIPSSGVAQAGATGTEGPQLVDIVQGYLWPQTATEFGVAEGALRADPALAALSLMEMHELEAAMRAGPPRYPRISVESRIDVTELLIEVPGGTPIPVFVDLPSRYTPDVAWPLIFAMHGGPSGSAEAAISGAARMVSVWQEEAERMGWIIAAPAMVTAISQGGRTADRLPYEVFQPEIAKAVIGALRERYNINPDRVVSTGISLGSNFSIAYGAAHPDWLSGIVPVSTEGDSRERFLRNLVPVPTYVLEGALDQNIRAVSGPRSLATILTDLGGDITYREFGDRAHEGFAEHYGDVLRWLDVRPRALYPREVWRVPHSAIIPVSRQVFWIGSDTRQGLIHASVTSRSRIDIRARWASEVTVSLHDQMVDLDAPIEIWVNGERAFSGEVARSAVTALQRARELGDERRIYAAEVTVSVPTSPASIQVGIDLSDEVRPTQEEGILSFWEMYAQRSLEERFPGLGITGDEVELPPGTHRAPEQVGFRVANIAASSPLVGADLRPGDVLVEVGGEPIFRGMGGDASVFQWLVRELRAEPKEYSVQVQRGGVPIDTTVRLRLGPYSGGFWP